jgi:hypothetical protein
VAVGSGVGVAVGAGWGEQAEIMKRLERTKRPKIRFIGSSINESI